MTKGKVFYCELTISTGVKEKLLTKHQIEMWEIKEIVYEDMNAFSLKHKDCYFIYGRTFAGRYLLILVRLLSEQEVTKIGLPEESPWLRVITAREMNKTQKRRYIERLRRR
ncbi:MAG: hypothetical protein HY739_08090 [Desulfobacterales bacterium]|nr:hypothetical protein [Desulfobacterales bacterium]